MATKRTLVNARMAKAHGMGAAKEHLAALVPQILASEDATEGAMSFTQRREPAFKGK